MNIKRLIALGAISAALSLSVQAYDFSATIEGNKIYFKITNREENRAAVTYGGSINDLKKPTMKGEVSIPGKVLHGETVYTIDAVGAKAFAHETGITGVTLPVTIKRIDDFAFEGCTGLKKVIYPGNQVELGEGVFFMCKLLSDISFGSDWETVDLAQYRWSDMLNAISIPARVTKLQGLKSLKYLEKINVDANNSRFASFDGVLYNKDCTVLYGVPRNYRGALDIKEGVKIITRGALLDCPNITSINIPASVESISFLEPSRMKDLESISFRGCEPPVTAYDKGEGVFLLQVANSKVKINVPNDCKNNYKKALVTEAGEYTESKDKKSMPYMVTEEMMPKQKNIKGVK